MSLPRSHQGIRIHRQHYCQPDIEPLRSVPRSAIKRTRLSIAICSYFTVCGDGSGRTEGHCFEYHFRYFRFPFCLGRYSLADR